MKKILSIVTALALSMILASGVLAATTKPATKKAPAKKTAAKKVVKKAPEKQFIEGSNLMGQTGLLWAETAKTTPKGKVGGAAHLAIHSDEFFTVVQVPVGVNFGLSKCLEAGATAEFMSVSPDEGDSTSGLGDLTLNGKYQFDTQSDVKVAAGLDVGIGPLSDDLGESTTDITPKGMVTYTLKSGVVLNGTLGFVITGGYEYTYTSYAYDPITMSVVSREVTADVDPDNYIQLGAGVGIPVSPKLSVIGELGLNAYGDEGSILGGGIRTGGKMPLQAMLGIGLGDFAPDFVIGGGICF